MSGVSSLDPMFGRCILAVVLAVVMRDEESLTLRCGVCEHILRFRGPDLGLMHCFTEINLRFLGKCGDSRSKYAGCK